VTCAGLFNPGRAPFINFIGHIISLMLAISKKSDSIFVTDCLFTSPSSKIFTRFEF
jgi:hypothetical protein